MRSPSCGGSLRGRDVGVVVDVVVAIGAGTVGACGGLPEWCSCAGGGLLPHNGVSASPAGASGGLLPQNGFSASPAGAHGGLLPQNGVSASPVAKCGGLLPQNGVSASPTVGAPRSGGRRRAKFASLSAATRTSCRVPRRDSRGCRPGTGRSRSPSRCRSSAWRSTMTSSNGQR